MSVGPRRVGKASVSMPRTMLLGEERYLEKQGLLGSMRGQACKSSSQKGVTSNNHPKYTHPRKPLGNSGRAEISSPIPRIPFPE